MKSPWGCSQIQPFLNHTQIWTGYDLSEFKPDPLSKMVIWNLNLFRLGLLGSGWACVSMCVCLLVMPIWHAYIVSSMDSTEMNSHMNQVKEERTAWTTYIPRISSIRLADFPYFSIAKSEATLGRALEGVFSATESQCILFNSFYELEKHVIDSLRAKNPNPYLPCGPHYPLYDTPWDDP